MNSTLVFLLFISISLPALVIYFPILNSLIRYRNNDFNTTFYFLARNLAAFDIFYLSTTLVHTSYVIVGRVYLSETADRVLGCVASFAKQATLFLILAIAVERVMSLARTIPQVMISKRSQVIVMVCAVVYAFYQGISHELVGCFLSYDPVVHYGYALLCKVYPPGLPFQIRTLMDIALGVGVVGLDVLIAVLIMVRRRKGSTNDFKKQMRLSVQLIVIGLILGLDILGFHGMNLLGVAAPPTMHYLMAVLDSATTSVVLLVLNPVVRGRVLSGMARWMMGGVRVTESSMGGSTRWAATRQSESKV